jgi:hypothetical protein
MPSLASAVDPTQRPRKYFVISDTVVTTFFKMKNFLKGFLKSDIEQLDGRKERGRTSPFVIINGPSNVMETSK